MGIVLDHLNIWGTNLNAVQVEETHEAVLVQMVFLREVSDLDLFYLFCFLDNLFRAYLHSAIVGFFQKYWTYKIKTYAKNFESSRMGFDENVDTVSGIL